MQVWLTLRDGDILVPVVKGVFVDKHRLDLERSKESLVLGGTVVYVESDSGLFGRHIAIYEQKTMNKVTYCSVVDRLRHSQCHFMFPYWIMRYHTGPKHDTQTRLARTNGRRGGVHSASPRAVAAASG